MMRIAKIIMSLFLLLYMLSMGYAQEVKNTLQLTWKDKKPGQTEILICSMEGTKYTIDVSVVSAANFVDGTYELKYADQHVTGIKFAEFPRRITFNEPGEYSLIVYVKTTEGDVLSTTYQVRTVTRPAIFLEPASTKVKCIGSEVVYLVNVYGKNTKGTKYTLNYDDGSPADVMTNEELKAAEGKFTHIYKRSYCHEDHEGSSKENFKVALTVENECGSMYNADMTYSEKVVEPIDAQFTFSNLNAGYACTFSPLMLKNTTKGGLDANCLPTEIAWEWDLGNGKKLYVEAPEITYEEARAAGYNIKLTATNGYECAADSAREHIVVVDRVKTDFTVDRDTLCSNNAVTFTNKSSGGGKIRYKWFVTPETGFEFVNVKDTVSHPKILFKQYGVYKVQLYADNGCSSAVKDTTITVKEDPEVIDFFADLNHVLDSMCPQNVGQDLRIDMQDYAFFDWRGNHPALKWSITPADGVTYESGYNNTSEFPRFALKPGKTYDIQVELKAAQADGVECGDPKKRKAVQRLKVNNPVINIGIITTPEQNSEGVVNVCVGESVVFTNTSTGENLRHRWSITPIPEKIVDKDWMSKNKIDDPKKADQTIVFNAYGDFLVTDTLISEPCYRETKSFRVHVGKAPTITYFGMEEDSLICSGSVISPKEMEGKVIYGWYNNEEKVTWECPAGVEMSDKNAIYPEFKFPKVGTYILKVSLKERNCLSKSTVSEREVTIRVRDSDLESDLSIAKNDFCEEEDPVRITNIGQDTEGECTYSWSIKKDGDPFAVYDPKESPVLSLPDLKFGTYQVIGRIIGYCAKLEKELEFVVHKNPEVILKDSAFCPGVITLATAESYHWWNNTPQVTWSIIRQDGDDQPGDVEMAAGALTQLYPVIDFKRPGKYQVKATLPHAGCPAENPVVEKEFWVYDPVIYGEVSLNRSVDGEPLKADICENETVEFINTMTEEAGKLSWEWTVESEVVGGYQYVDGDVAIEESVGRVKKEPIIRFLKYGEYKVKVKTSSTCNPLVEKEFHVTVRGIPEIEFSEKMKRVCAGDGQAVDMAKYIIYKDRKNAVITPEWSITPETGFTWEAGYGADSDTPRILFHENAHYVIQLTAKSKCANGGEQVLSSEIDVIYAPVQSIFSVGVDSVGCVNDPNPYEILLKNASVKDSLQYTWTVLPESGWEWIEGDNRTESPRIKINEEGNYAIRLFVTNGCQEDDSVFTVKAFGRPTISVNDIADECEKFRFSAANRVSVDLHNDTIRSAVWTVESNPGYASEGYEFVKGTTAASFYPDIDFRTCDYTVRIQYYNRCVTPGEASFRVEVDKFIPIEPVDDDAICELTDARELKALPVGGYWTLGDPTLPGGNNILQEREGKYYFNPAFSAYEEKDIKLVYNFKNLTCVAHDTMNMHVWPLPYVEAGDSLEMCLNHDPMPLVGLDSARQATWQANRGAWVLGMDTLKDNHFKTVTPGDFKLFYEYTDLNTCRNVDSTLMTVHALPKTGFAVNEKNCILLPVLFTPEQPENNTFEWVFGDNTTGHSDDTITHLYTDYGYREVICRAESNHGCRDTSETVRIEIVNLPPTAFFDVDTLNGCAPFEVKISINRDDYVSDHNYLSFHWDYGEGTLTDSLGPIVPKFYPSGAWDTTYLTTFTVSNMCGSSTHDTTITVYSVPKVSFALMHQWECSPVFLELQNTTTGNNCSFDWTFTNKRTGAVVGQYTERNPSYEFVTDSKSTTFYITLKAQNVCNEDQFTDSLVVKPRQISAHFTPLEDAYACVDEEIFFRNNSSDTSAVILNTYWNFGDGEKSQEWSPRHAYAAEGNYTVSLKIDNGCGWDTITSPVQIMSLPKLTATMPDALCEKDTATLVLTSDRELSYVEWNFGDGEKGFKDKMQHIYEQDGIFNVVVKGIAADFGQCVDSVVKVITIHGLPEMTILPLDTLHCSPLLYMPQVAGDALLMWDYGDGSGLTTALEHQYENPTDSVQHFRVIAYAETDKGCKNSYERSVKIANLPRAHLDKVVEKGNPQKVTFINLSEEYTNCIWELPLRGTIHSRENQVEEFRENGTYAVTLTAENYYGCQDSTTLEYEVLIKGLYFPNTFIPHSLNPKINHFNGIGIGLMRYRLEIFDLYNNKIWETRALENGKPSEGWDGSNTKGERMPQGIYVWRAEAIFGDDEVWTGDNNESRVPQTTQGTVMLMRE